MTVANFVGLELSQLKVAGPRRLAPTELAMLRHLGDALERSPERPTDAPHPLWIKRELRNEG